MCNLWMLAVAVASGRCPAMRQKLKAAAASPWPSSGGRARVRQPPWMKERMLSLPFFFQCFLCPFLFHLYPNQNFIQYQYKFFSTFNFLLLTFMIVMCKLKAAAAWPWPSSGGRARVRQPPLLLWRTNDRVSSTLSLSWLLVLEFPQIPSQHVNSMENIILENSCVNNMEIIFF